MKTLVIEDEYKTALDLKSTLQEIEPGIEVLDVLDSVEGSIEYLQSHPMPELIFMDIQLSDGQSFEIFSEVKVSCPVIFCTAFDEYAIEAFKVNGIDYVLKPFDKATIKRSLDKVKNLQNFFQNREAGLNSLVEVVKKLYPEYRTGFLVSFKDKLLPISVNDIDYFYIEHEVTFLHTFGGQRHILNYTLDELETMLNPHQFYRANRQYLVNYQAIREVEHFFARKLLLKLSAPPKEQVLVSKAKASDFLRWMEQR